MTNLIMKTWREQRVRLGTGKVTSIGFEDTRPNHVNIVNNTQSPIYIGFNSVVSNTMYEYMVLPSATKLIARPRSFLSLYAVQYGSSSVQIKIESYQDEFTGSSISQSAEIVTTDKFLTETVITKLPPLSPSTNKIGVVDVSGLPALPAGTNKIGSMDVSSLPSLPTGSNKIGVIDVASLPQLPAGTNKIGGVDVKELPPLPAGTNKIGLVDVSNQIDTRLNQIKTKAIKVTSTPTPVSLGLVNRKQLILYPPDSGLIYWGTNTVNDRDGIPLKYNDSPVVFDINENSNLEIFVVQYDPLTADFTIRVVEAN